MHWQLFLILYLVLGTGAYLLRRSLAQSLAKHNRLINGFFFLVILYPLGLAVAAFTHPNLEIGWFNLLLVLVGSGMFPIISLLAFRASKDIDAGHYTVLNNVTPIITIAAATLLLGEALTNLQMLGAAIIIFSAFLVTSPLLKLKAQTTSAGLAYALASVCLLGIAIVFERWMLTRMDFGAYLVYGWGAQTLWMFVMALPERKNLKLLAKRENFWPILGYGVTNALKGLCFVTALTLSGNASLVGAFASFMAVLVVLSAYFVLNEKQSLPLKITGAALGTIGLIILNFS